jgi:flagellar protein FlbT
MFVNGASIRFRSRCRIELVSQARFLFGKQIMAEGEAVTAVERLYYAVQTAYAGPADGKADALQSARSILDEVERQQMAMDDDTLAYMRLCLDREDFYALLKTLRTILRSERSFQSSDLSNLESFR